MRVVALISGGKDSCYNMMQCVSAGHTIVALANLMPHKHVVSDELDSYMYQTVGHQAVDLYAEALDLPLYRRIIEGSSLDTGREYSQRDGDEVEDLYHLLQLVKEKENIEAVSVGAILSDYQRVRVENVCARLQLRPLAYLWRRDQAELLREMISSGLNAILIKVAAFGLDPEKHLGKSLDQMESYLQELSQKYGVHICGEGGEYETFTTDCPLFKKKIVIDSMETVIHSADAFAPVGYLHFTQMHTEVKRQDSDGRPVALCKCPCQNTIDRMKEELKSAGGDPDVLEDRPSNTESCCEEETVGGQSSVSQRSAAGYQWITGLTDPHADVQSQTRQVFTLLQSEVQARGLLLDDVVLVHLYVSDLQNFSLINSVYCSFFKHNPPARVCVQLPLPGQQFLRVDVLLHHRTEVCEDEETFHQRDVLHVQGLSHWAPANIGPYSQAVRVDEVVLCAGQIALVPCTLRLVNGCVALQTRLCFSHVEKVLNAVDSNLTLNHVMHIHIYVTDRKHIPTVMTAWRRKLHSIRLDREAEAQIQTSVVVVSSLPRGAAVEPHVIAVLDEPSHRTSCHMTSQIAGGTVECDVLQSSCGRYATASVSLCLRNPAAELTRAEDIMDALVSSVQDALEKTDKNLSALCARVFYQSHNTLLKEIATGFESRLRKVLERSAPAVALVPVHHLPERCVLHMCCWMSV
ncbi:LOW QUALITY PROTEIN: diphthine--ammonia ligase [Triplophysa dalaica]|uniref:LOW QUALITY PROTEIN: diphthine--ammonia ligase n=1 Tax=Triplophysa dalaica TaxID=1582913 RepID=UPI0024DF34F8|nr:LOW QUALITY PROTEIN: diphthine--ammonia ligase [Triplophysa dalaica]